MKTSAASFILLFFAATQSYAALKADLTSFHNSVLPLLSKYCMDCHDADTKKGSFDLETQGAPDHQLPSPDGATRHRRTYLLAH